LKELNYTGKKDEKNIKTFVDNLPTKSAAKQALPEGRDVGTEMKEKDAGAGYQK
jgi:hypothetical protein